MNENFEYIRVSDIPKYYPLKLGTVRSLLAKRNQNGLDLCVRKIGRGLMIRRDLFQDWIEAHGTGHMEFKDKK